MRVMRISARLLYGAIFRDVRYTLVEGKRAIERTSRRSSSAEHLKRYKNHKVSRQFYSRSEFCTNIIDLKKQLNCLSLIYFIFIIQSSEVVRSGVLTPWRRRPLDLCRVRAVREPPLPNYSIRWDC
jgi:hypothetical protein